MTNDFFHFKNLWHKDEIGRPIPYDMNVFDTFEEYRENEPHQWFSRFTVRFKGTDGALDEPDIFNDPNEVFTLVNFYCQQKGSPKVLYVKHKGQHRHFVGLKFVGLDGWYNAEHFSIVPSKESLDNPFKIILTDPPPTPPERGTPEFKQLFKETGGACLVQSHTEKSLNVDGELYADEFNYLNHIIVTRTPEQYPKWLTELLNKPSTAKPKKK